MNGNKEIGQTYIYIYIYLSYNQFRSLKLSKEEEVKLNITLYKKVIKSQKKSLK